MTTKEALQHGGKWVETDPDNKQFGRHLGGVRFEFKERGVQEIVDLSKESDAKKESVASSYYGSLANLKRDNGDGWEWILAECIFEDGSGLY